MQRATRHVWCNTRGILRHTRARRRHGSSRRRCWPRRPRWPRRRTACCRSSPLSNHTSTNGPWHRTRCCGPSAPSNRASLCVWQCRRIAFALGLRCVGHPVDRREQCGRHHGCRQHVTCLLVCCTSGIVWHAVSPRMLHTAREACGITRSTTSCDGFHASSRTAMRPSPTGSISSAPAQTLLRMSVAPRRPRRSSVTRRGCSRSPSVANQPATCNGQPLASCRRLRRGGG